MDAFNIMSNAYRAADQVLVPDPGNAGTISVSQQLGYCPLVSAGAETRTMSRPEKEGVFLYLHMKTDGGDITLTVTGGYDENGSTTLTFDDPGEGYLFVSCYDSSAANYYWRLLSSHVLGNFSSITPTATELNLLSGLLATAAELNRSSDLSTRIVNTTATTLSVTLTQHSDKIIVVDSTAPLTATLPAASGSGAKYTFLINTAATATQHVITCGTLDVLKGAAHVASSTTDAVDSFLTTATDDKLSLNGTTTGGAGGDRIEIIDSKLSVYNITAWLCGSGTIETGFAAT